MTTVLASDAFTGTDGASLVGRVADRGGLWTVRSGAFAISSNKLSSTTQPSLATLSALVTGTADYDVLSDIQITDNLNSLGVTGRHSVIDATFYHFRWLSGFVQLFAFVSGTATLLTEASYPLTNGTTARLMLRMRGSLISGHVNGAQIVSVTDTAITAAGTAGLRNNNDAGTAIYDAFSVEIPATESAETGYVKGMIRAMVAGVARDI